MCDLSGGGGLVASWIVDHIAQLGVLPMITKLLILPATFCANYVFMDFLTKRK